MTGELCLIDTDILSYILKRLEPAYQQSCQYLKKHKKFTISCLTYYECFRGYKAVSATKRMQVFKEFLDLTEVLMVFFAWHLHFPPTKAVDLDYIRADKKREALMTLILSLIKSTPGSITS
jgi:hypothetical protein